VASVVVQGIEKALEVASLFDDAAGQLNTGFSRRRQQLPAITKQL
jgi:hypothetical protein